MRGSADDENNCSGDGVSADIYCWGGRLTPHRKRFFGSFDRVSRLFGGGAALLFLLLVAINAFVFAFVVVGRRRLRPLVIGNCFATGGVILLR